MPLSKKLLDNLKLNASKSTISHKHACVAMIGNKIISPIFHNYTRCKVFGTTCGSIHSEMGVINYLLNNICRGNYSKKKKYVLQTYKLYENK